MKGGPPTRQELTEFIWNFNFPDDMLDNDLGEIHSFHLGDGCMEWAERDMNGARNNVTPYICLDNPLPPPLPRSYLYSPNSRGYRYFDPRDLTMSGYTSNTAGDYSYGAYKNKQLRRLQKREVSEFLPLVRAWFDTQVSCLGELLGGALPDAAQEADQRLVEYAVTHGWAGNVSILLWHGQDMHPSWSQDLRQHFQRPAWKIREAIRAVPLYMREELVYWYGWLFILCEGLAEKPVRMETANLRPRIRTRSVLHPRQPVQDAINEFALRLVTHPGRYMAHIKQPHEYHHTKLVPQAAGVVSDETVESVRQRSQELYVLPEERSQSLPEPAPEEDPQQPPLTRRPPPLTSNEGDNDDEELG